MKQDILDTQVATIISENGYTNNDAKNGKFIGDNISLYDALCTLPLKWKDMIEDVAKLPYHSKEQLTAKSYIPRYYISGTYDMGTSDTRFPIYGSPLIPSNLMTIDVDGKDNNGIDIWELRKRIFELPYVFSCLRSVSNMGFYCIIPIKDTNYTTEYYTYIYKLWKQKFDIDIDIKAKSLVRARIISYNDDIDKWMKDETTIWDVKSLEQRAPQQKEFHMIDYKPKKIVENDFDWTNILHKVMTKLIEDGYYVENYYAWYYLGCECANFDDGKDLFFKASMNYPHNRDTHSDIDKRWKGCKPSGINDDLIRKWCGMAKKRYGNDWMKKI